MSIVLATDSLDLQHRIKAATDGASLHLPLGPLPPTPDALLEELGTAETPDVVVLDAGTDPEPALVLAEAFDRLYPGLSVLLVTDLGAEVTLAAMRVGVRDLVHPAAEPADLHRALTRAVATARAHRRDVAPAEPAHPSRRGRVVTIASPKGGVGKTTVATNLAVGLAQSRPSSTVLVDLDVQFGDVASALDLEPEYALPDAVHGPASRDTMVLKTFLTLHSTSLYVICGPKSPADADSVTADDVSRLLQMLATEFDYVVVDTAPGLSEHVLAVLDETTDLVLVTSMDVPGVRGLRTEMDALAALGVPAESRHVVLNMVDTRGGLSVADIEATLGTRVDVLIPRSKAALESVNEGIPLLQKQSRDPMAKELQGLVTRFTASWEAPPASETGREPSPQAKAKDRASGPEPKRAGLPWFRLGKAHG